MTIHDVRSPAPSRAHADAEQLIGLAALAKMAFQGVNLSPLGAQLLNRVTCDDNDANALMDLSLVMHLLGHRSSGLSLQSHALQMRQLYHQGCPRNSAALRLLSIACPGDLSENNALEFLIEGSDISLDTLYVAPGLPVPSALPDHDLVMVAISESERNRPLLDYAAHLLHSWPRPVLCPAARLATLTRNAVSLLLQSAPGLAMPPTSRINRQTLETIPGFPLIARPVGCHKGQGLARLDNPEVVSAYLAHRQEREFYAAPYIDYRSPDGQFRKYRIVLIGGSPYACHLAISSDWIVHYISAGMNGSAEKRAEEARFFETFDTGFALRHRDALRTVAQRVNLEYFGIDCAETPNGDLLIFEVDSAMTVHAMDPPALYPYKPPQMRKVFSAFRQMLLDARTAPPRRYADLQGTLIEST